MHDDVSRRSFLAGTAGVAALAAAGAEAAPARAATVAPVGALPDPADSGIDHIVVVMMENRSFDHYLGWLPGADGRQAGLTFPDRSGVPQATHHLTVPYGCGFHDPDHSYGGGRIEFDGGGCDGWLRAGANDLLSIGYFTAADLPFTGSAAPDWTVCDRYFAAVMGPTYPNRMFQHAAQTDRLSDTFDISTTTTIWDRLKAAGVSNAYYFSDIPFTALWGTKHLGISRSIAGFYLDAARGTLPAVSFVEPLFLLEQIAGLGQTEHPISDIRIGQNFLNTVYNTLRTSPNWERTLLVVNYDEWGGFFDHVPPEAAPDPRPDLDTALRGFRVPCLLIGPRARRGAIAHETYDHTSVLKMIEWRWGLAPLTVRDAAARNIAEVLDFDSPPDTTAPTYHAPLPLTLGCKDPDPLHDHANTTWADFAARAKKLGF